MVTYSELIEILLNAFRDLVGQFALRDWGRFPLPVSDRNL